jgi:hypothetical protein
MRLAQRAELPVAHSAQVRARRTSRRVARCAQCEGVRTVPNGQLGAELLRVVDLRLQRGQDVEQGRHA